MRNLNYIDLTDYITGSAQPKLTQANLKKIPVPLPPLAEQRRIVEASETQLMRLDAGVASLRSAQTRLRRYRASVLKAACEARRVADATNARLVEDSLAPETCVGVGTIGLELLDWPEPLDAILVALGNGALLTGVGRWVKAHAPQTQVIGVVAAGAPAMAES